MAKNQNLALNPSKVSGGCGRLLCCLTYEDETYKKLRQKLLPKGARVRSSEGEFGDVIKGDILNQVMLVEMDSGEQKTIAISELEVVDKSAGVEDDDWGDDIDLDGLMGDESGDESQNSTREAKGGRGQKTEASSSDRGRPPRDGRRDRDSSRGPRNHSDRPDSDKRRPPRSGRKPDQNSNPKSAGGKAPGNERDGEGGDRSSNESRPPRGRGRNRNPNRQGKPRNKNRGPDQNRSGGDRPDRQNKKNPNDNGGSDG